MSEMKIDRASRSADTRAKTERRKPWTPPSRLDTPPAPEGYEYLLDSRLKSTVSKTSKTSTPNCAKATSLCVWKMCRRVDDNILPTMDDGKHAGVIAVGGLLLAKIPKETILERNQYFRQKAQDQLLAVDNADARVRTLTLQCESNLPSGVRALHSASQRKKAGNT